MKILALDLASVSGWAFGEKTGRPLAGEWRLPGFDGMNAPHSYASIYTSVKCVVAPNKIDMVVVEAALIGIKRKNKRGILVPTSAHGDRTLTKLSGAAQAGAIAGGAKIIMEVQPNEWRAAVLGNGYPKDPKAAAEEYCRLVGWPVPRGQHNAAEALCIFQWGLGQEKLL